MLPAKKLRAQSDLCADNILAFLEVPDVPDYFQRRPVHVLCPGDDFETAMAAVGGDVQWWKDPPRSTNVLVPLNGVEKHDGDILCLAQPVPRHELRGTGVPFFPGIVYRAMIDVKGAWWAERSFQCLFRPSGSGLVEVKYRGQPLWKTRRGSYWPAPDSPIRKKLDLLFDTYIATARLLERYSWQVALRNEKSGVRVSFFCSSESAREAFALRDKPAELARRPSLRHWVVTRAVAPGERRTGPRERFYLRGAIDFSWAGLECQLTPADFDREQEIARKARAQSPTK